MRTHAVSIGFPTLSLFSPSPAALEHAHLRHGLSPRPSRIRLRMQYASRHASSRLFHGWMTLRDTREVTWKGSKAWSPLLRGQVYGSRLEMACGSTSRSRGATIATRMERGRGCAGDLGTRVAQACAISFLSIRSSVARHWFCELVAVVAVSAVGCHWLGMPGIVGDGIGC